MTIGRGNFDSLNIALLLTAVFGVGLFVLAESRSASPLIRLAMFRDPVLSANFAMSALVSTVMMVTLVVGPSISLALGLEDYKENAPYVSTETLYQGAARADAPLRQDPVGFG